MVKQTLLDDARACVSATEALHKRFDMPEFLGVMQEQLTICLAASRGPSTSPSAVTKAKALICEHPHAVQVHDGLQFAGVATVNIQIQIR